MNSYNSSFGRFYDDFSVGQCFNHWPGKTILESDNNLFSLLTMNHHPVHIDANYAADQKHGRILVVGTLVLSLSVGLTVRDLSGCAIANLEYNNIKHLAPVFVGDTIYAHSTIQELELCSGKDKGIVFVTTKVTNQNKLEVLTFERKFLVPCSNLQT